MELAEYLLAWGKHNKAETEELKATNSRLRQAIEDYPWMVKRVQQAMRTMAEYERRRERTQAGSDDVALHLNGEGLAGVEEQALRATHKIYGGDGRLAAERLKLGKSTVFRKWKELGLMAKENEDELCIDDSPTARGGLSDESNASPTRRK